MLFTYYIIYKYDASQWIIPENMYNKIFSIIYGIVSLMMSDDV